MYKVTITVEYWRLETEECEVDGMFEPCKMIHRAEMHDYKSVRQYIASMLDRNTEALSFNVSVKPIKERV